MKMKKLAVCVMSLAMAFSLMACGGSETEGTTAKAEGTTAKNEVEVPKDQVEGEQAKADADYEQLTTFLTAVVTHEEAMGKVGEMSQSLKDGEITQEDVLAAQKELADDSVSMYKKIQDAEWQTEYYSKHVEALTAAFEAIAAAETASYDASANNDEGKLKEAEDSYAAYNTKMDEVYALLGIE